MEIVRDKKLYIGILIICITLLGTSLTLMFNKQTKRFPVSINNITPTPSYIPHLPILDQVFAERHDIPSNSQKIITLIVTGDIIPARSVNVQSLNRKNFKWAFEDTADFLRNGDITLINLETPLLDKCLPTVEGMIFCGDTRHIEGLVYSGVDVVSLANNHAGNYGEDGVAKTVKLLEEKGIVVMGLKNERQVVKEVNGVKFTFLGYNDITTPQPGVSNVDKELIEKDIAVARNKSDVVIVVYHWGVEYRDQPDERQKELAHFTIDSGADLVIGNHPHWIQPIEIYKGKLITYAHGNFVFDQMWSQKTREGVVGKYTFYGSQLIDVQYFPVQIDDYGQPHFVEGDQKKKILEEMKQGSYQLASKE